MPARIILRLACQPADLNDQSRVAASARQRFLTELIKVRSRSLKWSAAASNSSSAFRSGRGGILMVFAGFQKSLVNAANDAIEHHRHR